MPDKKRKFETKVHRKTLNPFFNETFAFKNVSHHTIPSKYLDYNIFKPSLLLYLYINGIYFVCFRCPTAKPSIKRWFLRFSIMIVSPNTIR